MTTMATFSLRPANYRIDFTKMTLIMTADFARNAYIEDTEEYKTLTRLKKDFPDMAPINIHMFKHIPTGAGLGGGSADAAFMIKLLNNKFKLDLSTEKMEEYAAILGADCAFFIQNKPVFASGIGNIFESINLSFSFISHATAVTSHIVLVHVLPFA